MIIIIDGYNLLKQVYPHCKKKSDAAKIHFLNMLSRYKALKTDDLTQIILVFDAGPLPHATRETHRGIVIIHSGQRQSADDWIINYALKHSNQELLIITKDRGIISACKKKSISSMDVFVFYKLIETKLQEEAIHQKPPEQKSDNIHHLDSQEYELPDMLSGYHADDDPLLNELMEVMSDNATDQTAPEAHGQMKKGNPQKKSKKERKEERQLKKLK